MTSLDFAHSGPHDSPMPDAAVDQGPSRLAVAARRIAHTIALIAFALAVIVLRYWLFFPHIDHAAG